MFRNALCAGGALVVACSAGPGTGGSNGNPGPAGTASGGAGGTAAVVGSGGSAAPGGGTAPVSGAGMGNLAGMGPVVGAGGTPGSAGAATGGTTSASGGSAAGGTTSAGGSAGTGTVVPPGDIWVATNGVDANPGTEALPVLNIANALARITAGHTIFLKAGTYKYSGTLQIKKSGTAAAMYTISAAPGTRPVIDFTTGTAALRGFDLVADYWHFVGFDVENSSDNCIAISGSHNIIENMHIHNCGDTGLQISASTAQALDNTRAANNLVLNCDSYLNFDAPTLGENADGFAAKLRIGPGNVFRGCRSYNNADDGWDFFASDDVVVVDGCWAFSNGKGVGGNNPAGDGNGFKLGGAPSGAGEGGAVHLVTNSFGFENLACGFTQNSNPDVPQLTGCGALANKTDYCQTLTRSATATMTMTAAQAKAVVRNADGSLPPMK